MATNTEVRDWLHLVEPEPAADVQQSTTTGAAQAELEPYLGDLDELERRLVHAIEQLARDVNWAAAADLAPDEAGMPGLAMPVHQVEDAAGAVQGVLVEIPLFGLLMAAQQLAEWRRESSRDVPHASPAKAAGCLDRLAGAIEAAERLAPSIPLEAWRAVPREMQALPGWNEHWAPVLRDAAQRLRGGCVEGRPRTEGALVADLAARHYLLFAGKLPRESGTGASPLYRYAERLFKALGVKGSAKKHVDHAVQRLKAKSLNLAQVG